MRCVLEVNGTAVEQDVEPRLLLVDVLRDRLGLTGTKVACDTAQCGSCVVQLNGGTVKSCQVLAVQASGSAVLTIEGVGSGTGDGAEGLTDLQAALWRTHGSQCGFCTPGVVMAMRELLMENSAPTADEVRAALAGNLCRCGAYSAIVEAVTELGHAAVPEPRTAPDSYALVTAAGPTPGDGR